MPILQTNHVVQGFIPAGCWAQNKKQLSQWLHVNDKNGEMVK